MNPKFWMLVFFSCFATLAVGQITLEQKDIIARNLDPMPGKAIVYVIRHSGYAFLVTMEIGCDSSHIGSVGAEEYVYTVLDPGKHTFISSTENKCELETMLEAGKIYYIKLQVNFGVFFPVTKLKLLSEERGKKYLNECKLANDNTYSN